MIGTSLKSPISGSLISPAMDALSEPNLQCLAVATRRPKLRR